MSATEATYSHIYESETDFDNVLLDYDFQVMRDRLRGPRVLELGCGRGTTTRLLAGMFPQLDVVDASQRCLDLAAIQVPASVKFYCSYFEQFEPSHQYDSIVMAHVLEHLEDPVGVLRRVQPWLNTGGGLHLVVPNAGSLHRRICVAMGMLPTLDTLNQRDLAVGHRRVYNKERLVADVQQAGLRVMHHEGILLKILANSQMEKLDRKLTDALFHLSHELPDYCADLYLHAVAT